MAAIGVIMSTILSFRQFGRVAAAALIAGTLGLSAVPEANARAGGGFSTGSRGLKTFTPPPATRTAPGTAQPMQRSAQQAPQTAGAATAAAARPASRFGTGFMGGLLGAGLIGALLGAGFFGGMNGILGMLGFLLQAALIAGLVYWAVGYFRRRNQPASATPYGQDYQRTAMNSSAIGSSRSAGPAPGTAAGGATQPLTIEPADYTSFERLLSVIQLSYGREDLGALRSATTGEMLGYFTEQLEANARNGVRNELGQPKLLSGDLAEAWSEATGEYASVAMRYSLTDATLDRNSGRVIDGSTSQPQEVTEVWTFARRHGGGPNAWKLSAIQQTA